MARPSLRFQGGLPSDTNADGCFSTGEPRLWYMSLCGLLQCRQPHRRRGDLSGSFGVFNTFTSSPDIHRGLTPKDLGQDHPTQKCSCCSASDTHGNCSVCAEMSHYTMQVSRRACFIVGSATNAVHLWMHAMHMILVLTARSLSATILIIIQWKGRVF